MKTSTGSSTLTWMQDFLCFWMTCTEGGVELEMVDIVEESWTHREEDVLKVKVEMKVKQVEFQNCFEWKWVQLKNGWHSSDSERTNEFEMVQKKREHYIENESESDRWESGQLKWRNGFLKYRRWVESEMEKMESESEKVKLENTVEWNAYDISCWTVFQLKAYFLSFWKVYSTSSLRNSSPYTKTFPP